MKKLFTFLGISVLSLGSVIAFMAYGSHNSFSSGREFRITYSATINSLPKDSQYFRVWIPLASSREGQTIVERKITAAGKHQITVDPVYGNEMAYFELESPLPDSFDVQIEYGVKISGRDFEKSSREKGSLQKYLKSSTWMTLGEEVRKRTQNAVQGKEKNSEKARAIYEDVIGRMSYDKTVPGWGRGDTLRACQVGKGNCTDFHSLFISMAHAAQIAARFKIGFTIPQSQEGEIAGYHCWAEFYEEAKGWRPVDASEAWKRPERKEVYFGNFDINKFLISVGRDIDLVPRQSGPPVNIFFYPHVEADGKVWEGMKTSFRFQNFKS